MKVHTVLCTINAYHESLTFPVRVCMSSDRAVELTDELNNIYEQEMNSIPYPKSATAEEDYSYEKEQEKHRVYEQEKKRGYERVRKTYSKHGINIPDIYGDNNIGFYVVEVELED